MSRNLFSTLMIIEFLIIAGTLGGCKTQPEPPAAPEPPPQQAEPVVVEEEEDVWALLEQGDGDKARPYFLGRIDANARDAKGRTPLHIVAEIGDPGLAGFFIARGAEVNALDSQGRTPLDISAEKLDPFTARVLVGGGGDIHHPMAGNLSPARIGVQNDKVFLAAILNSASLESADPSGRTILHMAAEYGNIDALKTILMAGKNSIAQKDKQGKTALDIALERTESRNHAEMAEYLILAGGVSEAPLYAYFAPAVRTANYNIRSADGMAPLHYFSRGGYLGYISYALERQANINIKNASGATALHEAARSGNLKVMEFLLDHGADVNALDAKGNSVLHIAMPSPLHEEGLKLLLSRGANPNIQDEHGDTPLHIMVILNRPQGLIQALWDKGADLSIRNIHGKTPLYLAVENERVNLIPALLSWKSDIFAADINGLTPYELALTEKPSVLPSLITDETVYQSDGQGNTILHLTMKHREGMDVIGYILDKKAPVNARNKEGDISLHLAVRMNYEEAGTLLLNRGGDIFAPNDKGESPLYLTFPGAGKDSSELRQWMLTPQTLSARDGLGNTALHYTAQWQFEPWIPMIIQMGAAPDAPNATGEPPLFSAVKVNASSTIQTLVNSGSRLDSRDNLGNSALHAAVRWNAPRSAATLIALGLDVNCHALNGKTPLHDAVRLGTVEIETLLLDNKADLEARDTAGNTPFMEAVGPGYSETMVRLAARGANPNTRNFHGDTSLHLAASRGSTDMSTLLLNWGASIHARNSEDRTPFQNALAASGSPEMVKTLLGPSQIFRSDDYGSSPLHVAIQEKASLEMVKTILGLGCPTSALDYDGRTPLRLAVDLNQWETAKFLADSGADVFLSARDGKNSAEIVLSGGAGAIQAIFSGKAVNARDASGNTILHYAARLGDPAVITQLLELGANKGIRNIAAESPADIAQRWKHFQAQLLLQ